MTVSKYVGKKMITSVEHCTARRLPCYSPKLWQQMDISTKIGKWNYITHVITPHSRLLNRHASMQESLIMFVVSLLTSTTSAVPERALDKEGTQCRVMRAVCAAFTASVLDNAFGRLGYEEREAAFGPCDEVLGEFVVWPWGLLLPLIRRLLLIREWRLWGEECMHRGSQRAKGVRLRNLLLAKSMRPALTWMTPSHHVMLVQLVKGNPDVVSSSPPALLCPPLPLRSQHLYVWFHFFRHANYLHRWPLLHLWSRIMVDRGKFSFVVHCWSCRLNYPHSHLPSPERELPVPSPNPTRGRHGQALCRRRHDTQRPWWTVTQSRQHGSTTRQRLTTTTWRSGDHDGQGGDTTMTRQHNNNATRVSGISDGCILFRWLRRVWNTVRLGRTG